MSVLLLALAVAPAPKDDLRLGLTETQWRGLVSNTLGHVAQGYTITQVLHPASGDALVRWSSTASLDPRGPNALGLQLYGPDGMFRRWLPDTARINRDYVLCGRYLIGGGNTLRVWDTEQNYAVMARSRLPGPLPVARLKCDGGNVLLKPPSSNSAQEAFPLRFSLPLLLPLPAVTLQVVPLPPRR
ncbi:hypothetical protein [Deinococcus frigens]|uniref:hypothetical protein n=1 Tax=Deinococcus frigens TaxID=249403 RepID=UPI0012EC341C|nr:hypothetical protein [Deinococcus frigens]